MVAQILQRMAKDFDGLYAPTGRPSVPRERLLRYYCRSSIRSTASGSGRVSGQRRRNETHESRTDPDSRLYRKGNGQEAKLLGYLGHILIRNRRSLIVDAMLTHADGAAERDAALLMMYGRWRKRRPKPGLIHHAHSPGCWHTGQIVSGPPAVRRSLLSSGRKD